jgi:hypothetical protein
VTFEDARRGLLAGDFSRLDPLFITTGTVSEIVRWYESGLFAQEPQALAEAFTCACFNGRNDVVDYLLARGVNPDGGQQTGLTACHWAANRGHLATVQRLIRAGASLESRNSYGGTVLGCAVWSLFNEPRPEHWAIIENLLQAGANAGELPEATGDERLDELLRRFRAAPPHGGARNS